MYRTRSSRFKPISIVLCTWFHCHSNYVHMLPILICLVANSFKVLHPPLNMNPNSNIFGTRNGSNSDKRVQTCSATHFIHFLITLQFLAWLGLNLFRNIRLNNSVPNSDLNFFNILLLTRGATNTFDRNEFDTNSIWVVELFAKIFLEVGT